MLRKLILLQTVFCACFAQTGPAVRLTLHRAIEIAISQNPQPNLEVARELERVAESRYAQGRAAMLPSLDMSTIWQNQTRNLYAQGFRLANTIPGLVIPKSAGPFNTFDARVALSQPVFDLSAIRRSGASRAAIQAAKADTAQMRDEIAVQVAHAYARVLRENAVLDAGRAAVERAQATLESARRRHDAGAGIAIDVTRAEYQVAREQQAVSGAKCEQERAVLALLDAMGLSLDTRLEFEDGLRFSDPEPARVEQSLKAAVSSRSDFEAVRRREENLRLKIEAVRSERLPTVAAYADAGALGGVETHTIGVAVRIPIFDGGRRKTKEAETAALLRQEQARESKLQRSVELAIRQSEIALRSAAEQVSASESYMKLAEAELAQARRRHDAGVTGALDVIEAQYHLAAASRDHVDALFRYTEARIDAVTATGTIKGLTL
jgi:outer membrane protein